MASKKSPKKKSSHPIMDLLEVLGRRWVLRILWELREGPLTFRGLQSAASDVSPSVLNERLAELREVGLLELGEGGYEYTEKGRELAPLLMELDGWARRHRFSGLS
ncbi:MAG: helix-turn-helix domain-containing protein [Myxococcales bacterium]